MAWLAGVLGGGTGVFMFLKRGWTLTLKRGWTLTLKRGWTLTVKREWTLTLKNNSEMTLIPDGTSESSGSLNSPLKEIKPGKTESFIWKKTFMSEAGAVGAIHFKIGDTGNFLTVFGCIPMNMGYYTSGCNIYIGKHKPTADDLENGTKGCMKMVEAGQFGAWNGCTYTITHKAEAELNVEFDYKK